MCVWKGVCVWVGLFMGGRLCVWWGGGEKRKGCVFGWVCMGCMCVLVWKVGLPVCVWVTNRLLSQLCDKMMLNYGIKVC